MARSAAECAADRHARRITGAREALEKGDARRALWVALNAVMSEAVKITDRRISDGQLLMTDVTGMLLEFSAGLHKHRPQRPRGCPPAPRPEDLLRLLDESLSRAAAQGAP